MIKKIRNLFAYFVFRFERLFIYLFGEPTLTDDEDIEDIIKEIRSTKQDKVDSIKICCSINAYHFFLKIEPDKEKVFGCLNDLSYGDLKNKKYTLINDNHEILLTDFLNRIDREMKVELIFNSNNSCEYCNFLYILSYLTSSDVLLLDTGKPLMTEIGELTISRSEMIPINYMNEYKKSVCTLTKELNLKYQEEWQKINNENASLRFIENGDLKSVDEKYFDERIKKKEILILMNQYGLSEDWFLDRYKKLNN